MTGGMQGSNAQNNPILEVDYLLNRIVVPLDGFEATNRQGHDDVDIIRYSTGGERSPDLILLAWFEAISMIAANIPSLNQASFTLRGMLVWIFQIRRRL